jgi:hypothetical protein
MPGWADGGARRITITDGAGDSTTVTTAITVADARQAPTDDDQGVPDDTSRATDRTQAVVRAEEAEAEDDPLTMPSGDAVLDTSAIIDGEDWDAYAIASLPLGDFGNPLDDAPGKVGRPQRENQDEVYVVVTTTTGIDPSAEGYTQSQDTTVAVVNRIDRLTRPETDGRDQWEEMRRNDALFIALPERAENAESSCDNGLLDGLAADTPAVSVWEDLAAAVRSVLDDLSGNL